MGDFEIVHPSTSEYRTGWEILKLSIRRRLNTTGKDDVEFVRPVPYATVAGRMRSNLYNVSLNTAPGGGRLYLNKARGRSLE